MEKSLERLTSIFKEEMWARVDPKSIGISKFKVLEDIFNEVVAEELDDETLSLCREYLEEHKDSVSASYLVGLIGYHRGDVEDSLQLRKLIDLFMDHHKWAVVEVLSEKILEYGESSAARRALAKSLERLGRHKEAIPEWENLLKIERFDSEVARNLANALINEDPEKSIYYMKLSIEGFLKNRQYDEVTSVWNKLVSNSWEDISFFERIERQLVEAKKYDLAATLLKTLLNKYRDEENPDVSIELLKKILSYRPDDSHSRRELIKLYEKKYGEHSQFSQFLEMSNLNNFKKPVKLAIQDFERNIFFDRGNYAYHTSWGLGKIEDIDSESIVISFQEKENHRMSIQMALQSLTPIPSDHIYVLKYEDPEGVKELFENDFIDFFTILIRSYGGTISLDEIKREFIPEFVEEKNWTRWWNRARTQIKKSPNFGVSEKKKNEFFLRDKPLTFADELLDSFTATDSFSGKLNIAIEFVNNIDASEGASVTPYFIDYFADEARGNSMTRQVLSYFILRDLDTMASSSTVKLEGIHAKVMDFIRESFELPLLSRKIGSYDYKKEYVNLIEEARDDWPSIYYDILFEVPVRIHKYIMNRLIIAHEYQVINQYIDQIVTGYREFPELFLWVARNLLNGTWNYDWLDYSRQQLVINFFRFMNELKKVETEGNRLKNACVDLLFDNNEKVLREIVSQFDQAFMGKVYDIFRNLAYVEESKKERLHEIIREYYPDFSISEQAEQAGFDIPGEKLIVTPESYEQKKAILDRMVNEDLVNLSKELARVAENSSDPRENVDYNALMEKQNILELEVSKLEEEIRIAEILDPESIPLDTVSVGSRVTLRDVKSNERITYTLLGPWDADFARHILSYRSPIARTLLGKHEGDETVISINDEERSFRVENIEKYSA